jgi:carbon storage regulator
MLVLSRQRDETIMIGDEIEITVVDIRGDKVRLGITAPTRISVHRKEVYEAIKAENQRASQLNKADVDILRRVSPAPACGPNGLSAADALLARGLGVAGAASPRIGPIPPAPPLGGHGQAQSA